MNHNVFFKSVLSYRTPFAKHAKGFTLLEVLVGLIILAITLAVTLRVTQERTETVNSLKSRILAHWVAENKLTEIQLNPEAFTATSGDAQQAGQLFFWVASSEVASSSTQAFLVTIDVSDNAHHLLLNYKKWIFPSTQRDQEQPPAELPAQNGLKS